MRASIEVADIFRAKGPAYRAARAGHLSLDQLKVMSAIEHCRTAVMGGHVEACTDCGHWRVAYNSCRNRHCPRCQGAAARIWLAEREADLLPVGYFHVVFTLPAEVADIALQNKPVLSNCVQAVRYWVLFLSMALRVMRSFRMVATIASLKGLPASRSRLVVAARCPLPERAMVSAAR